MYRFLSYILDLRGRSSLDATITRLKILCGELRQFSGAVVNTQISPIAGITCNAATRWLLFHLGWLSPTLFDCGEQVVFRRLPATGRLPQLSPPSARHGFRPGERMTHPRTVITEQRKRVLRLLSQFHYLTNRHFYQLLGVTPGDLSTERGVRRLLVLLVRAGLLESSRHVIDKPHDRFLRYENCYRLSRAGALAIDSPAITGIKSPASLAHELLITDFHLALATSTPSSHRLYWRQTDLKHTVNPDALFAITDTTQPRDRSTWYYFLEVENCRQGHYRRGESGLLAKLRKYVEYRRTDRCRGDWHHFSDFHVIVVLRSQERQMNLLRILRERMPRQPLWTTCITDCEGDMRRSLFRAPPDFESAAYSLFTGRHERKEP